MKEQQLPGFEISRTFVEATDLVINIANELQIVEEIMKSGQLDAQERKSLGRLWDVLTAETPAAENSSDS